MAKSKLTRVIATAKGYHDKLYQPGDEFNFLIVKDKDGKSNLGSWMEVVKKPKSSKKVSKED